MNYKDFLFYSKEFFGNKNNQQQKHYNTNFLWYQIFNIDKLSEKTEKKLVVFDAGKIAWKNGSVYMSDGYLIKPNDKVEIPKGEYHVSCLWSNNYSAPVVRLNYLANKNPVVNEKENGSIDIDTGAFTIIDPSDIEAIKSESKSENGRIEWDWLGDIIADGDFDICTLEKVKPAKIPILIADNGGDGGVGIIFGYDKDNKLSEIYLEGNDKELIAKELSKYSIQLSNH